MSAAEIHQLCIKFFCSQTASRHIRIVGPHDLHTCEIHLLQCLKIRLPAIVFLKVVCDNLSLNQLGSRRICRVTWVRNQYLVSRIQECKRDEQDSLF